MQSSLLKYGELVDHSKENRKNLKRKILESPNKTDETNKNAPKVYKINF